MSFVPFTVGPSPYISGIPKTPGLEVDVRSNAAGMKIVDRGMPIDGHAECCVRYLKATLLVAECQDAKVQRAPTDRSEIAG